jgi:hypothetical protein
MAKITVDRNVIVASAREPAARLELTPSPDGVVLLLQEGGVRMTVLLGFEEAQALGMGLIVGAVDSVRAKRAALQDAPTLPALPGKH